MPPFMLLFLLFCMHIVNLLLMMLVLVHAVIMLMLLVQMRMNEWTEKVVQTMKVRITEYSHYISRSRESCNESDSNLGSPKPAVGLGDDFEPSCQSRSSLNDVMSSPNLEQESDLPLSLSPELAPHPNS